MDSFVLCGIFNVKEGANAWVHSSGGEAICGVVSLC